MTSVLIQEPSSVASASAQVTPSTQRGQPTLPPQFPEGKSNTKDKATASNEETDSEDSEDFEDSEDEWEGLVTDCCGRAWPAAIFKKQDPPPVPRPGDEKWVVFIINYPRQRVLNTKEFADMVNQMECELKIIEEDVPKWHPQLRGKWTIAAIPHHIFCPPYTNECSKHLWDYAVKRLKLKEAEGVMYYTQREWNGFVGGNVDWPWDM
ncbi:hypothetical protein M406DRAFT_357120 [Cryphonectria parasitica EP155]|uniref:Uncharacterized protein n=1 Tax=Cryphonectria parasitica (strain ATCC 38755 / EP155) TaxID=660469 RepID=A0A9P4XYW2_CRYP1|nr:uncharacterized protein M406DRAFT_357120 [Cryphonectria parasitica EP155]KAF3763543.1 hypothetical protein M406DRAFT_357120 [Cryphonectria parasitica EP155]